MTETASSLNQYIQAHFDTAIQDLIKLCSIPTVATDDHACNRGARAIEARLRHAGASTQILKVPGAHPSVYGIFRGQTDLRLLFYNHYDVEPPGLLDQWSFPPFSPHVADDHVFGRGTADNKGSFVARVQAVEALIKTRGQLPCTVAFLVEAKKDVFAPHLEMLIDRHRELFDVDACIWENSLNGANGLPTLRLGDKGMCAVEIVAISSPIELSSQFAAVVPSAAWSLVWALAGLRDRSGKVLIEGFYDGVEPPTKEELEMIRELPTHLDGLQLDEELQPWKTHGEHDLRVKLCMEPTCNIGEIKAGPAQTGEKRNAVIPSQAAAQIDIRLVPRQDPDEILRKLRRHFSVRGFHEVEVRPRGLLQPHKTPWRAPFVESLTRAARRAYEAPPVLEPLASAAGTRYALAKHFPIMPIVGIGIAHPGSNIGGPNENIRLDDYRRGIEFVAAAIEEFAAA